MKCIYIPCKGTEQPYFQKSGLYFDKLSMLKIIIVAFLNLLAFNSKAQVNKIEDSYYSVDKLEVYNNIENIKKLMLVKYFQGKISLTSVNNKPLCMSFKTGKEYLKFEEFNNNYKVSSAILNDTCSGLFSKNIFQENELTITLRNPKSTLIYYLTKIPNQEIYSKIVSGSGIIINRNTVLTNYHVVKSFDKIQIEFHSKIFNGIVLRFDEQLDIALVRIDEDLDFDSQHLSFANYNTEIGTQTFVTGFPLINTMGKELKITSGIISSLKGYNDAENYLETSAPIDPGNSGGALIDIYGNIIGIISSKHAYGTNAGYALKTKLLLNNNYILITSSKKTMLTTQQIYNKAKNTLCILKCYLF